MTTRSLRAQLDRLAKRIPSPPRKPTLFVGFAHDPNLGALKRAHEESGSTLPFITVCFGKVPKDEVQPCD